MGLFTLLLVSTLLVSCSHAAVHIDLPGLDGLFSKSRPEKQGNDAYDFVFDIKSISDLASGQGWVLEVRNWTQGENILKAEFQGSITSVLGMYNRRVWSCP